jgi:hypothetical protein
MEKVRPNTYHINPTNILLRVPLEVAEELKGGDVLSAVDYPGVKVTLTKKDVRLMNSYDLSFEDVYISVRRVHEGNQYFADGILIYKNSLHIYENK